MINVNQHPFETQKIITADLYKGSLIEKAYQGGDEGLISAEIIRKQLDNKLEKGIIDQELHSKAIEQLEELSGDRVEVTVEKGGVGSGRYKVYLKGGSIGEKRESDHPRHGRLSSEHDSLEEAKDKAKRFNKMLSPGEKKHYGLRYHVVSGEDKKENGDLKKAYDILGIKYTESEEESLEKASKGEGSRGGHVIGHTKSGKPVYAIVSKDPGGPNRTKSFSAQDHLDAKELHEKRANEHRTKMFSTAGLSDSVKQKTSSLIEHHFNTAKEHEKEAHSQTQSDQKESQTEKAIRFNEMRKKEAADQKKKQNDKHQKSYDYHKEQIDRYEAEPTLLHEDHHLNSYNFHKDRADFHKRSIQE